MKNFYSPINLTLITFFLSIALSAQEVVVSYDFTQGFEGWTSVNDSEPQTGISGFSAENWGISSRYLTGRTVISDWVISPVIQLLAGDIVEFQVAGGNSWRSFVELRLSQQGTATANPIPNNGDATELGDFTSLLFTGDPDSNFPNDGFWKTFSVVIPETAAPTEGMDFKLALRHYNNSDDGFFLDVGYLSITRQALSVQNINKDRPFGVYPNPAIRSVRFEFSLNENEPTDIDIYALSGEKVYSLEAISPKQLYDMSALETGFYLIRHRQRGIVKKLVILNSQN